LDVLKDDVDDLEKSFEMFLSKERIGNSTAEREAQEYLQLSRKQRVMEDILPKARRLINEPPFPTLPQAVVNLAKKAGQTVNEEEASQFIKKNMDREKIGGDDTGKQPPPPPPPPPRGKSKTLYYWEDSVGGGHILIFVNRGGSCSMRRFNADSGIFSEIEYEAGNYQDNFAQYILQDQQLHLSKWFNLVNACRDEHLPDYALNELRPQIERFRRMNKE
jgi:hypothetical protein